MFSEIITKFLFIFMLLMMLMISHPLPLSILISLQTINLVIIMFKESMESFTSMILLLLFIGGILILFTYVASLIPNKIYPKINKSLIIYSILFSILFYQNFPFTMTMKTNNFVPMNYSIISKFNMVLLILMIIILLMINIEMLTKKWMGSLRSSL